MHTMSGLYSNIPDKKNWIWTRVWSLMMDLTVVATLVLLGTGLYLWLRIRLERRMGHRDGLPVRVLIANQIHPWPLSSRPRKAL